MMNNFGDINLPNSQDITSVAYENYMEKEQEFTAEVIDVYKKHIGVIVFFNQLLNSIDLEKWVKVVTVVGSNMLGGVYTTQTDNMLGELGKKYLDCHKCSVNKVRNLIFKTKYRELLDNIAIHIIKGIVNLDFPKIFTDNKIGGKVVVTGDMLWEMLFEDRWMIEDDECFLVLRSPKKTFEIIC